jgi:hypothetical protein
MAEPAFNLHDTVEYRWSGSGPFIGEARVVEIFRDGRYRLERLDGTAFPIEGSIFREEQLRLRAPVTVSVLARGGISGVSARRAECPIRWSPARA